MTIDDDNKSKRDRRKRQKILNRQRKVWEGENPRFARRLAEGFKMLRSTNEA